MNKLYKEISFSLTFCISLYLPIHVEQQLLDIVHSTTWWYHSQSSLTGYAGRKTGLETKDLQKIEFYKVQDNKQLVNFILAYQSTKS